MSKLAPVEIRTRAEQKAGRVAAKIAGRKLTKIRKTIAKAKELSPNIRSAAEPGYSMEWGDDASVNFPAQVKEGIATAEMFYQPGRFFALIDKTRLLAHDMKVIAPTLRMASASELEQLTVAVADFNMAFASAQRYGAT